MKTIGMIARVAVAAGAMWGAPGLQAAQVVVGQVGPMSGMEANQGRAYATGMQLYFDSVNKGGGVNGHTFRLVRRDDGGRPEDTIAGTRQLLAEDRPLVLTGFFGSRNVAELVNTGLLEKERIPLVGYRTSEVRPETPLMYSIRAGVREELNKLTAHLALLGIKRLGLFYEDGPGAEALVAAADDAAKKVGAGFVGRASYPAGTARINPAVDAFLKIKPQAILMVGTGAAAAGFIEQYRAGGGAAQLFTHSGADIEQMTKRLSDEQMLGIAIAQVTPSPYRITTRLSKEFQDAVGRAQNLEVPVSYAMIEGYIAGKVIVESVRRQGGKAPSRQATAEALDSMGELDLGGYTIGFRPDQRTGSKFVDLSIISSGKLRQ